MKGFFTTTVLLGKDTDPALAEWLSWLEHHPVHQQFASLIPSQCAYLGCVFGPHLGNLWDAMDQCFSLTLMFLSLSLSLLLSLTSLKTYFQVRINFVEKKKTKNTDPGTHLPFGQAGPSGAS